MKLGIGTYSYMWAIGFKFGGKEARPAHPMTALGLLQRAVELGVHLVQYGPNLSLSTLGRPELEELIVCARQWNVELELRHARPRNGTSAAAGRDCQAHRQQADPHDPGNRGEGNHGKRGAALSEADCSAVGERGY